MTSTFVELALLVCMTSGVPEGAHMVDADSINHGVDRVVWSTMDSIYYTELTSNVLILGEREEPMYLPVGCNILSVEK